MAELYNDWLVSKMTRAEFNDLSPDEKKERKRLQMKIINRKNYEENSDQIKERNRKYREENPDQIKERNRKYREENPEKEKERVRKYREENPEKQKEYSRTPAGKKVTTLSKWKHRGLQETKEELDRIYELYLKQELCNACDCVLTRTGKLISTDATMDHDHITHRFRHIICRGCNCQDSWKKYFC